MIDIPDIVTLYFSRKCCKRFLRKTYSAEKKPEFFSNKN